MNNPVSVAIKPIYQMDNLIQTYGSRQVLDIDHLEIYSGEIFAMVGPSGAGKTSLLRLMNFLERPTQGKITFEGIEYQNGEELAIDIRRRVTMVFQRPLLLNRNVLENVEYGLHLRNQKDQDAKVQEIMEELGLDKLARQPARTLSGGEMQRVALARALVLQPDVLLLDEPTANLDPYNVKLIEEIILRHHQKGLTLILVTHNVFQARRLAQRVGLLLEGKLIEVSSNDVFFHSPNDPRTFAFTRGEMVY